MGRLLEVVGLIDMLNQMKNYKNMILLFFLLASACAPEPPEWMTDPGEIIYQGFKSVDSNCSRCHGRDGRGGMEGKNIRNALRDLGEKEVFEIIMFGKGDDLDGMPPLKGELSQIEAGQVIDYMRRWLPDGSINTSADSLAGSESGKQ